MLYYIMLNYIMLNYILYHVKFHIIYFILYIFLQFIIYYNIKNIFHHILYIIFYSSYYISYFSIIYSIKDIHPRTFKLFCKTSTIHSTNNGWGVFFIAPINHRSTPSLPEVCDSGTLAGSALPSCQALPCNFSWPGPKVCLGVDQLGGFPWGFWKVGVTNQVAVLVGLSWLGSDRFELCMGSRNFHNFLELSWSTRILIWARRCFVLFFVVKLQRNSCDRRKHAQLVGWWGSSWGFTQKNLQRVLSFVEIPKQCQVEVWLKSRKFSFPNAGWVSSVRWIRRFMVNLLRCLDFFKQQILQRGLEKPCIEEYLSFWSHSKIYPARKLTWTWKKTHLSRCIIKKIAANFQPKDTGFLFFLGGGV